MAKQMTPERALCHMGREIKPHSERSFDASAAIAEMILPLKAAKKAPDTLRELGGSPNVDLNP
jgi:hypothetical protein